MSTLLHVGLANLLCASALAVAAALVGRYARRPALTHSLWLLVLLKLVTPPFFTLPVLELPAPPAPPTLAAQPQVAQAPKSDPAAAERRAVNAAEFSLLIAQLLEEDTPSDVRQALVLQPVADDVA